MKNRKVLIGSICGLVAVAAVIIVIVLMSGDSNSARNITVFDIIGSVKVERNGKSLDAIKNMKLVSGDTVEVGEGDSFIRLCLDDDKFVYADAKSTFKLQAEGTSANSKTVIYQMEGTLINEVTKKLEGKSSYEVVTPNTTMAIRGTITYSKVQILDKRSDNNMTVKSEISVPEGVSLMGMYGPNGSTSCIASNGQSLGFKSDCDISGFGDSVPIIQESNQTPEEAARQAEKIGGEASTEIDLQGMADMFNRTAEVVGSENLTDRFITTSNSTAASAEQKTVEGQSGDTSNVAKNENQGNGSGDDENNLSDQDPSLISDSNDQVDNLTDQDNNVDENTIGNDGEGAEIPGNENVGNDNIGNDHNTGNDRNPVNNVDTVDHQNDDQNGNDVQDNSDNKNNNDQKDNNNNEQKNDEELKENDDKKDSENDNKIDEEREPDEKEKAEDLTEKDPDKEKEDTDKEDTDKDKKDPNKEGDPADKTNDTPGEEEGPAKDIVDTANSDPQNDGNNQPGQNTDNGGTSGGSNNGGGYVPYNPTYVGTQNVTVVCGDASVYNELNQLLNGNNGSNGNGQNPGHGNNNITFTHTNGSNEIQLPHGDNYVRTTPSGEQEKLMYWTINNTGRYTSIPSNIYTYTNNVTINPHWVKFYDASISLTDIPTSMTSTTGSAVTITTILTNAGITNYNISSGTNSNTVSFTYTLYEQPGSALVLPVISGDYINGDNLFEKQNGWRCPGENVSVSSLDYAKYKAKKDSNGVISLTYDYSPVDSFYIRLNGGYCVNEIPYTIKGNNIGLFTTCTGNIYDHSAVSMLQNPTNIYDLLRSVTGIDPLYINVTKGNYDTEYVQSYTFKKDGDGSYVIYADSGSTFGAAAAFCVNDLPVGAAPSVTGCSITVDHDRISSSVGNSGYHNFLADIYVKLDENTETKIGTFAYDFNTSQANIINANVSGVSITQPYESQHGTVFEIIAQDPKRIYDAYLKIFRGIQ